MFFAVAVCGLRPHFRLFCGCCLFWVWALGPNKLVLHCLCFFVSFHCVCTDFFNLVFFAYFVCLICCDSFARVTVFCVFSLLLFLRLFGLGVKGSTFCASYGSVVFLPILTIAYTHVISIFCIHTCVYVVVVVVCVSPRHAMFLFAPAR